MNLVIFVQPDSVACQKLWRARHINIAVFLIIFIGNAICYQNLIVSVPIFIVSPNGYAISNPATELQTDFSWFTIVNMAHVYPFLSLAINVLIFVKLIWLRVTGTR
ncbi:unnamed protein product, partial [Mesorhabditis belari]|uniref:Uncharacterized protein n=1 Tax=Mesorhabditis belari TaxID=2138241 RepID=A0AAF3EBZ5_9BILA